MFEKWKKNKEFERRSEGKTSEFTAIPPEVDAFKNTSAVGKLVKDQIQIKITYGDGTWEIISLSQLERLKNQGILKEVENIKEGSIKKGGQNQQPSYPRPLAVPSGQKKGVIT